jgi:hypothetical protein
VPIRVPLSCAATQEPLGRCTEVGGGWAPAQWQAESLVSRRAWLSKAAAASARFVCTYTSIGRAEIRAARTTQCRLTLKSTRPRPRPRPLPQGLWRGTVVAIKVMTLPARMSGPEKRERMVGAGAGPSRGFRRGAATEALAARPQPSPGFHGGAEASAPRPGLRSKLCLVWRAPPNRQPWALWGSPTRALLRQSNREQSEAGSPALSRPPTPPAGHYGGRHLKRAGPPQHRPGARSSLAWPTSHAGGD